MSTPQQILYLDFDGVLHPDAAYLTRTGIELLHHPGHELFENVPVLEEVLEPYPDVRIVLSTSWILAKGGYSHAKGRLSQGLQQRCVGGTFSRRETRKQWFQGMARHEQVLVDVKRRQPTAWLAIDDWCNGWPAWALDRVVRTDPTLGISEPTVLEDLKAKLLQVFG